MTITISAINTKYGELDSKNKNGHPDNSKADAKNNHSIPTDVH